MNILAIGPHPDDLEFGCAPILMKETKRGNRVKMLVLSRGEAGSAGSPELREQESRAAAALIGSEVEFLEFAGDCRLAYTPENAFRLAREIRSFKPETVLAPHPGENQHPDHSAAGRLVRDACRFARYGGLEDLKPAPAHRVANLFFYRITQHLQEPDLVIDITDLVPQWEAAMNCHQSQVMNKNYVELQKAGARLLGLTIGTEYALGLFRNDPMRLDAISDLTLSSRNF
ncbi:MAG TPA: PIG-L deacetylase family protein [Bryobacteraceae bacterium]|nr:PIG-L deacetylase family protein [Bryobacteraceae bacterium]